MGLTLGEIFFFEELAADCAADGRYAFLLVAPPLPVVRGVGTPIIRIAPAEPARGALARRASYDGQAGEWEPRGTGGRDHDAGVFEKRAAGVT